MRGTPQFFDGLAGQRRRRKKQRQCQKSSIIFATENRIATSFLRTARPFPRAQEQLLPVGQRDVASVGRFDPSFDWIAVHDYLGARRNRVSY